MKRATGILHGTELTEMLARPAILVAILSVLGFGFGFVGSTVPAPEAPPMQSIGAADPADAVEPGTVQEMDMLEADAPPPDQGLFYSVYKVVKGDTISEIAERYDITPDSIITFNNIKNARALSIGKYLRIPTLNGILYTTRKGDTPEKLSATFEISTERIVELNGLGTGEMAEGLNSFLEWQRSV